MDYRTTDIRTGLFIAFSIAAATVLVFLMGGVRGAFRDARQVRALFDDVRLLEPEAPVTLGGFRVGEVTRITSTVRAGRAATPDYRVEVVLTVDRDLELRADAAAVVRTDGFLGRKFVALSPGVAPETLAPGAVIPGRAETDLGTLMAQLEEPIARLSRILLVVERIAGNEQNIDNAEAVVAGTRTLLERVDRTTLPRAEGMLEEASRALARIDALAGELAAAVGATRESAERSLEAAARSMEALAGKAAAGVDEAVAFVNETRTAIAALRSDLGRLMAGADRLLLDNNRNIYLAVRNLRDATAELDRVLRKVRADPSVLFWGDDEPLEPRTLPEDLDARRRAGRARRYGKEPER